MRATLLFAVAALSASPATAAIVGYTFSGVTTTNQVEVGDITTEFPLGTKWTARVEWETTAAPTFLNATQGQYPMTKFTLTFEGVTGDWTTTALAGKASFTLNYAGGSDEWQFTTAWGPANLSNPVIENWAPFSINVILKDPTGTAIPALSPSPTSLDFSDWSPLVANSQLKLYLNNEGTRSILGNISSIVSIHEPEISVQESKKRELRDRGPARNFGPVAVGRTGRAKLFTIKNTGAGNLSGLSILKSGRHRKDFIVGKLARRVLAPGASTTFTVSFRPGAKGARSAALAIRSNDRNENPFDVPLSGIGRQSRGK